MVTYTGYIVAMIPDPAKAWFDAVYTDLDLAISARNHAAESYKVKPNVYQVLVRCGESGTDWSDFVDHGSYLAYFLGDKPDLREFNGPFSDNLDGAHEALITLVSREPVA